MKIVDFSLNNSHVNRMAINIKPSHKGRLHANLGIPQGKPIPAAKLASAKKRAGPAVKKQIQFAQNAKGFSHKKPAAKPYSFS